MITVKLTWDDETFEGDLPVTIGRYRNGLIAVNRSVNQQDAEIIAQGKAAHLKPMTDVKLNGNAIQSPMPLNDGDVIQIADQKVTVVMIQTDSTRETIVDEPIPVVMDKVIIDEADEVISAEEIVDDPITQKKIRFPPSAFMQQDVSFSDLQATGLPIEETTYLAIGGGLGSFIWVDHLVISGADPQQIVSIGFEDKPYKRYQRLCENSQIPSHERLRSDSGSTPDNIWGWPGYAVREIWTDLTGGDLPHAARLAWQIFTEPTLVQTYTPRSGRVFKSIDRESRRIGWDKIWRYGRVRAIRKTDDGRYAIAYSQSQGQQRVHKIMLAKYVHVAIGYPGIRLLKDLQDYREKHNDFKRVVNAYEPHDQVYDYLLKNGGTVMLRGRGIVASRVLQKLWELRKQNPNIGVLHLMRSPVKEGYKWGWSQREVNAHWEFQPFNWPKSAWTGLQRRVLENADDEQRDFLLNSWGGTTTADRTDWREIVQEGLAEGWYDIFFGEVEHVEPCADDDRVVTYVKGNANQPEARFLTHFIIDSTGLIAGVESHPLLGDLIKHYDLPRNPKGRLAVSNQFMLKGMENGEGRMYAAGVITLGGPHAAVDSFLGLQYAAHSSIEDLIHLDAPGLKHIDGLRSFLQWTKWARGVQP